MKITGRRLLLGADVAATLGVEEQRFGVIAATR